MMRIVALFLSASATLFSLTISTQDSLRIADKIWKNECAGTLEGLTHWGKGESFGSFGIGHFIWYAKEGQECFEETFPLLMMFLKEKGASMPSWLQKTSKSPWGSREEFYLKIDRPEMISLREMLFETRGLQAQFIVDRFEKVLNQITEKVPLKDKERVLKRVSDLVSTPNGIYAMVDYLNFKGSGLSEKERYQGEGWGLLQVLLHTAPSSDPVEDFVKAAKITLEKRVKNSPSDRGEERWLKGWANRLETYL
ncbi:MAG: hypothetical protein V4489_01710 [Chlamydiota bacterium]